MEEHRRFSVRSHRRRPPQRGRAHSLDGLNITVRTTEAHGIDKYPAKSHAQRLATKLGVHKGLIVLAATPASTYPYSDQPVPFRQDRYFYYLTGCNEPDCYVTYNIGKDVLTLWVPAIDESRVVWTGRGSTVDEALEKYDIDEARYIQPDGSLDWRWCVDGLNKMERFKPRDKPYDEVVPVIGSVVFVLYTDDRSLKHMFGNGEEGLRSQSIVDCCVRLLAEQREKLRRAMDACRVIKDSHEIELIRQANEITAAAHTAVLQNIHRLTNEAEVEAAYTAVCIAKHAKGQGYSPIAGSGPNASVLHYDSNNEDFGDRQMLVLDAGCEVGCYASDVTRAIPLNTKHPGHWPSKEAEVVYKLVARVQEACIAQMKPGKSFVEITYLARRMTLDGLSEIGVLKGDGEEIWKAGTVMGFFPHGLGHHLGLEVHDVSPVAHPPGPYKLPLAEGTLEIARAPFALPRRFDFATPGSHLYSIGDESGLERGMDVTVEPGEYFLDFAHPSSHLYSTADDSALEPGMVVTVEPGLYFNRFLLEQFFLSDPEHSQFIDKEVLERYWKVGGVRIEDDILVTRDGYENLTSAPKGKSMLEVIRKSSEAGCCGRLDRQ